MRRKEKENVKILHLIASNFVGGPEKQILRHACDATSHERKIWIGSFRDGHSRPEILDRAEALGLPTVEIFKSAFDPQVLRELSRNVREKGISLLCTHGFKANVLGWLAGPSAGCPQVAFARGWTAETWKVRQYERLDRFVLSHTRWVACVSRLLAEQLAKRRKDLPPPFIIPNAACFLDGLAELSPDRVSVRKTLGIDAEAIMICAAGRLSSEKGQVYLLEAIPALLSRFPNLQVVILGEGRERRHLVKRAQELGVIHAIHFPGFQRDVRPWIESSDVLVNPSLTEGTPNVVLEAMALGTPVVATAVGGVPELIRDRETGLLVPPRDPSAIDEAVTTLLLNKSKALQIADKARKRAQDFSPAEQLQKLLDVYNTVLNVPKKTEVEVLSPVLLSYISVVIPVRNEAAHLRDLLKDLQAQDYPADRFEIIVADGQSTDGTPEITKEFENSAGARVVLVQNPKQLSSAGRNVGVRASRGEIVIFIDGHCRVSNRKLLAEVVNLMEETGADCLCRPQPLAAPENTWFQNVVARVRTTFLGHGPDSTIYVDDFHGFVDPTSSGAIYKRSVFDRVGFFDESFDACEDVEFNYRVLHAGLRSYLSSRLAVSYKARSKPGALFRQLFRYGRGRFRFMRKHTGAASVGQFIPPAFVGWLVLGAAGSLVSRPVADIYVASLVAYAALVLWSSIRLALRYGWRELVAAPLVYFLMHAGLGSGFWAEAASSLWRKPPAVSESKSLSGLGNAARRSPDGGV